MHLRSLKTRNFGMVEAAGLNIDVDVTTGMTSLLKFIKM
jgi:hypothetical protein